MLAREGKGRGEEGVCLIMTPSTPCLFSSSSFFEFGRREGDVSRTTIHGVLQVTMIKGKYDEV